MLEKNGEIEDYGLVVGHVIRLVEVVQVVPSADDGQEAAAGFLRVYVSSALAERQATLSLQSDQSKCGCDVARLGTGTARFLPRRLCHKHTCAMLVLACVSCRGG